MSVQSSPPHVPIETYYAREDIAETRYEFHDGDILAMPYTSLPHSQVCVALCATVSTGLRGTRYETFTNLRTFIRASNRVVYPDCLIVHGKPEPDPRDKANGTIVNPRVVFEILSPGTERYDRTEKRDHYLTIPTLDAHVLIDQDRPRAEVQLRTPEGRWELIFVTGLDTTLTPPLPGLELPLRGLYDRVEFPQPTPLFLQED